MTRYVKIRTNGTYSANFHHYQDPSCSKPAFTIHVEGFFAVLGIKRRRQVLEGATPARFNFSDIKIYPHTPTLQRTIRETSRRACNGTVHALNDQATRKGIFKVDNNAFSARACRDKFGVSEYEFSILKLEKRKDKGHKQDLLYFGEIQTHTKSKRRYRPTSYQMPLKKASLPGCTRCALVRNASPTKPPVFSRKLISSNKLEGQWGSTTCESQPGSRFVSRFMKFDSTKLTWERQTTFFMDAFCQSADFTLVEEGSYHKSAGSTFLGSTPYVFTATSARMTPHDDYMKEILNTVRDNQCGKDNTWKVGQEQDITPSKGCTIYGISIPETTYELVKYDYNSNGDKELYLGQKRTDERKFSSPLFRPTSFQIPLVECSAFPTSFVPPTTPPTPEARTVFPVSEREPFTIPTRKRPTTTAPESKRIPEPTERTRLRWGTDEADMLARSHAATTSAFMTKWLLLVFPTVLWYMHQVVLTDVQ